MAGAEARDAWPKPLDVGNGQVCASFAVDGSWLSLGRPHPGRGFVELTGAPTFDEALRGRPDAVRRYRQQLTLAGNAALHLIGVPLEVAPDPGPPGRPRWPGVDRSGRYEAEAWAPADLPCVVQRIDAAVARLPISWDPRREPSRSTWPARSPPDNPPVPHGRRAESTATGAGPLSPRRHVPARLRSSPPSPPASQIWRSRGATMRHHRQE